MSECVILIEGLVCGLPTAFDGEYVTEYDPGRDGVDPNGLPMACHLKTTPDVEEALVLYTTEALELWKWVDPRQLVRADGKPNRPLTAFTVSLVKI